MEERADRPELAWVAAGALALVSSLWTIGSRAVPVADSVTAVLVPSILVLTGVLAPWWRCEPFTSRILATVGVLHLTALGSSAMALVGPGSAWWHLASQVVFVAGFALLPPLASGYPSGPAPRWTWVAGGMACLVPVVVAFAGPSPAVLGSTTRLGPIAEVLPPVLASAAGVVLALPLLAVGIILMRARHADRELRGRLTLPFAALTAIVLISVVVALLPARLDAVGTALFLVCAPLVPVSLVAGARRLTPPRTAAASETLAVTAAQATRTDHGALARLSPRERDVLAQMAAGQSNAAIARSLHISLSAVEKHTTAIFTKLRLEPEPETHRRVAAVVTYLQAVRD